MARLKFSSACWLTVSVLSLFLSGSPLTAQEAGPPGPGSQNPKSAEPKDAEAKPAAKKPPELPAQIELLETRVRFEANGDSRKEVHTQVRINDELGARQFARLNFDYNRAFQQVELPLMRITHASGGTADILPGAVSDQPNASVVNFPAYQDVRVKSVRILGLEPGDALEYRVVTTTTHHPLAPDFWLDHTFDRSGVVSQENFEIDLPASSRIEPVTSRAAAGYESQQLSEGSVTRIVYRWRQSFASGAGTSDQPAHGHDSIPELPTASPQADIILSKGTWADISFNLQKFFHLENSENSVLQSQANELTRTATNPDRKLQALYDFVSQKIRTVDLPLGATRFKTREPKDVLGSGYATPEDKAVLLCALARSAGLDAATALVLGEPRFLLGAPIPDRITSVLVVAKLAENTIWLDPSLEIAPFGVVASRLHGKPALVLPAPNDVQFFENVGTALPFLSTQSVHVDASLDKDGTLKARVHYSMRGENELLLREAFHQAPKEKWKEVAQLLALSDGFRGKVTNATASDPYATREPFTVEYEIAQPKFVDWTKKPVRIPALLPLLSLPDAAARPGTDGVPPAIELGTPLHVETHVTLHVPPDTGVSAPAGTSVERDYATFTSEYSAHNLTLTAERHIKFLKREVPTEHAADYAAFVRSVQSDQAQEFTLERAALPTAGRPASEKKELAARP